MEMPELTSRFIILDGMDASARFVWAIDYVGVVALVSTGKWLIEIKSKFKMR